MYYFIADIHLGIETETSTSRERELMLVRCLEEAASGGAKAIFLVGDIFDFWFEYKRVVPKGYTRLLGKLSELSDRGVEIHFFAGNHDKWVGDYLSAECGVIMHMKSEVFELDGKRVFIAHGDNMSFNKSPLEKLMQWSFHSPTVVRLFSALVHPNVAIRFGNWWSRKSRKLSGDACAFRSEEEHLVRYAREYQKINPEQKIDYFIFGHIHIAHKYDMGDGCQAVFLGEWLSRPVYAQMKGGEVTLVNL